MKILLYDIGSFTQKDLIYYLEKNGCICRNLLYKCHDINHDEFFKKKFEQKLLEDSYDIVMSMNFNPIVAEVCSKHNMKYISWIYDSPISTENLECFCYPTNYIFLFDRIEAERIRRLGNINIFHLPLAVNFERLHNIKPSSANILAYSADISFVGLFYQNPLKAMMEYIEDYEKGYIDGLIKTQLKVYGYNFIEEMLTEEFIQKINSQLVAKKAPQEPLTQRKLLTGIQRHITHIERLALCNMLGRTYQVNYYSTEQPALLAHLQYCGTANYFTEMPLIFKLSKLNLNPTLRSIQSGIPLRALDILGCESVLFSNYQPELAEYFEDGVDVIMYESIEDALEKADYYLRNEQIRLEIAKNGYRKACENFTYPDKIAYMFKTAGI